VMIGQSSGMGPGTKINAQRRWPGHDAHPANSCKGGAAAQEDR
jgi:hypothetical protein